jgi:hypothetical protein
MLSLRIGVSIGAVCISCAVVHAGPVFASDRQPAPPQKLADCIAAVRDKPTLDVKRLPGVRFRVAREFAGWENDQSGKQVQLVYPHGTETAVLSGGVRLRTDLGGCEDYSNQYVFEVPGRSVSPESANWLLRASRLLAEIAPANVDEIVPLQALSLELAHKALDAKAVKDLDGGSFEGALEGDNPNASYLVEVEHRPDKTIIRVSYSVHL